MAKQFSSFYNGYPTDLKGGSFDGSGGFNTSDATATPNDILKGKTAYGPDGLMTGTLECGSSIGVISQGTYTKFTDDIYAEIEKCSDENDNNIYVVRLDNVIFSNGSTQTELLNGLYLVKRTFMGSVTGIEEYAFYNMKDSLIEVSVNTYDDNIIEDINYE